jgi:hypothetical protein
MADIAPLDDRIIAYFSAVEIIVWKDHVGSGSGEWRSPEDIDPSLAEIVSIGVAVRETGEVVALAATVGGLTDDDGLLVTDVAIIAKALIVSRRPLVPALP